MEAMSTKSNYSKSIKKYTVVFLFLFITFFLPFLISTNVSAAAGVLTISIPDTISLDILPSTSGTFASTSSNITVRTTYAHGYTLGIAASTANSNALINTTSSSKTIPSITSAISESTFSSSSSYNNKWGYSPSKYNSSANTNYLVAPTSTTIATLDKTTVANSTNNSYAIKLGARIDSTLTPGTYENTFVFTVTANATPYTITYVANTSDTVTSMPSPNPQTGETFATSVNISNTIPARDGYVFKGWCSTQTADDAPCTGTRYNPNGEGTDLSWSIDQTATTNTLNLYAMWERDVIIMQTMSESDCVTESPTSVVDARDGETYLVQRLADGNCWLLDNLRLDPTSVNLANLIGNTNASTQTLTYFKNGGGSGQYPATGVNTTWTSSSDNKQVEPKVVTTYKDTTVTSYGAGSGKVGVYYNYCAASAGSYCYDSTIDGGNASEDICPAGWRMPTGGDYGEYRSLCTAYNGSECAGNPNKTSMDATSASSFQYNLSTPLSGFFSSGSAGSQGTFGAFWSSSQYPGNAQIGYVAMAVMTTRADNVYASGEYLPQSMRAHGRSVRCVKKYQPQPVNCPAGKICYNSNSNVTTGEMGKQSASNNSEVTLWASNFKRPGYGFAGWNTAIDYSGTYYGPNQTITAPSDVSTNGLSLYAVWVKSAGTLQNWSGCSSLAQGSVTALTDSRDNDTYAVAKLADNKCWMIENLRLDDSPELSSANTHNPSLPLNNSWYYKNQQGTLSTSNHLSATSDPTSTSPDTAWCQTNSTDCDDQSMLATNNTTLFTNNTASGYSAESNVYSYGNYYNWYSATAGYGKYGSDYGSSFTSPGDICPAGWHLPTGKATTGEFALLDIALGGTGASSSSSTTPTGTDMSKTWRSYPNNFVYSGYVYGSSVSNRDSGGYYWSASGGSSGYAYPLYFTSTYVYPGTAGNNKYYGRMVRCLSGS